jgi:hypothetical protein
MAIDPEVLDRLRVIKTENEKQLMRKANVVGVGVGLREYRGHLTDEPAIIVSVTHKVPRSQLAPEDLVPSELSGFPVDVKAVGTLRAF